MIFFFTDIHGDYKMFTRILEWCKQRDPQYTIIYGGDAADRGEQGYKIIKEMLNDERIVYLYGNHEDLFVQAAEAILDRCGQNPLLEHCSEKDADNIITTMIYKSPEVQLHLRNGGLPTLRDWLLDGANRDVLARVKALPRVYSWENYDFCHAGGSYNAFTSAAKAQANGTSIPHWDEHYLIWNRQLRYMNWKEDRTVVFGHTPVIALSINERDIHPVMWHNGCHIDMDSGVFWTKVGLVMDCENRKFYRFERDGSVCEVAV